MLGSRTVEELANLKWTKSTKKLAAMGAVSELNVAGTGAGVTDETTGIVSCSRIDVLLGRIVDDYYSQSTMLD